jgi:hypothetical protein
VLRPDGEVVILDSPLYHDPASGEQMVREREGTFRRAFGLASNALPSQNYLTFRHLTELSARTGLNWTFFRARYGWRWALRPWKARLLGRREPAQFQVIRGASGER